MNIDIEKKVMGIFCIWNDPIKYQVFPMLSVVPYDTTSISGDSEGEAAVSIKTLLKQKPQTLKKQNTADTLIALVSILLSQL